MDFSVEDKRQIALALDELGVDYIEGGWPGANPTDTAFFAERPPLKHARFTAFGMTKRAGRSAANDPALAAVLDARRRRRLPGRQDHGTSMSTSRWKFRATKTSTISPSPSKRSWPRGREPLFDAEHFFDGYKADPDYALTASAPPMKRAPDGSCCATPMAAPCRKKPTASSAR